MMTSDAHRHQSYALTKELFNRYERAGSVVAESFASSAAGRANRSAVGAIESGFYMALSAAARDIADQDLHRSAIVMLGDIQRAIIVWQGLARTSDDKPRTPVVQVLRALDASAPPNWVERMLSAVETLRAAKSDDDFHGAMLHAMTSALHCAAANMALAGAMDSPTP